MIDLIKKSMYMGLGTLRMTREKVESLVDEMVEKGHLEQKEKPNLVSEIVEKFEKEEKEMSARIRQIIENTISDMGLATKKDVEKIMLRLDTLDKKPPQTP
ncbi:MAG: polyhydroxyalkanoate synthesis regulator [Calditrichia bacterium]